MASRNRPWIMRTYSGHSTPEASNALYRQNLAKGQTGLSIAFDLPTQTGYDPDHQLAAGEVGKVGVPIANLGDMRALLEGIPLEKMNTSMTINATAAWLLALYVALAEERGIPLERLSGTTQNDIVKEYLSRGTFIFPPRQSIRPTADVVTYAVEALVSDGNLDANRRPQPRPDGSTTYVVSYAWVVVVQTGLPCLP